MQHSRLKVAGILYVSAASLYLFSVSYVSAKKYLNECNTNTIRDKLSAILYGVKEALTKHIFECFIYV